MISAILFINNQGEVVISRFYRDNVSRSAADAFRLEVIAAKEIKSPIHFIDGTSFMHIKKGNMFVVAVTKQNAHPVMVFEILYKLISVFEAYFGSKFDENSIRDNFVLIYELLDEALDFGHPQILSVDLLTKYIKSKESKFEMFKNTRLSDDKITSEITGAIDWREEGKYKYRKNEVFIDVMESVNILKSSKGETLKSDVSGRVVMKTFLSGMPECKFGMNDKLQMEGKQAGSSKRKTKTSSGIAIEDIRFHRCVRLGKFDSEKAISFIPPDGEFDLMSYRVTQNITAPFSVIAVVQEVGKRVEYDIKIKANFPSQLFATSVILRLPTPKNTARHKVEAPVGKTKYDPVENTLVWKLKKFVGGASFQLRAHVERIATIGDMQWSRPPITMDFQVPMFTSSGMHVRFLKVTEKTNYDTVKWVRYITKAGSYQIRI